MTMRSTILAAVAIFALSTIGITRLARAEPAKDFASPEEAAAALIAALDANDDQALLVIFGSDATDLVQKGSDPVVADSRKDLAAAAKKKLTVDGPEDGIAILEFGDEAWPSPIPLVKDAKGWHFDAAAGREELLARRIGKNELRAIALADDYPEAQAAYASVDRDGDDVLEFAQKLISTPGKQDGLYWEEQVGGDPSPLAVALDDVHTPSPGASSYGGYVWKILTAQGPNAPGGAYSYIINGNMVAGFALVGTPVEYRKTGVMSFMVSNNGKIYQKDLGAQGLETAKNMTAFDPDSSWTLVEDDDDGDTD